MNTLDRMIAAVSPQRAVKRAAARRKLEILDSGYSNYGASQTKKSMLGWLYGGGSAKEDIQENLSVLRQRCRDLYMGVPLATGALKTCRTNVDVYKRQEVRRRKCATRVARISGSAKNAGTGKRQGNG